MPRAPSTCAPDRTSEPSDPSFVVAFARPVPLGDPYRTRAARCRTKRLAGAIDTPCVPDALNCNVGPSTNPDGSKADGPPRSKVDREWAAGC